MIPVSYTPCLLLGGASLIIGTSISAWRVIWSGYARLYDAPGACEQPKPFCSTGHQFLQIVDQPLIATKSHNYIGENDVTVYCKACYCVARFCESVFVNSEVLAKYKLIVMVTLVVCSSTPCIRKYKNHSYFFCDLNKNTYVTHSHKFMFTLKSHRLYGISKATE